MGELPRTRSALRWSWPGIRLRRSKRSGAACPSPERSAGKATLRCLIAPHQPGEVPEHRGVLQPELVHGVLAVDPEAGRGEAGFVAREFRANTERSRDRRSDHCTRVGERRRERRGRTPPGIPRDPPEELARGQLLAGEDVALAILAALEGSDEPSGDVPYPYPACRLVGGEADAAGDAPGDLPA